MPLYEYKCESCGKTFEVIQKFSDTPLEVHADCGGKVIRLVSPSALHFKGSGWYVNDYARSGNGSKGAKDAQDAKDAKESKDAKDGKKESTGSSDSSAKSETKSSSSTPASSSDKSDKKV
jgi:putative FmdB family regulatory protein